MTKPAESSVEESGNPAASSASNTSGRKTSQKAKERPENVTSLRRSEPKPRLVVELNRATAAELDELVDMEDLNKTTIVNRAIQVYAFLRKAEADGAQILVQEDGAAVPQRIRFM